jgi:proteasome accessory factor C
MRDVGQRLRRLLYVVPYVAKHSEGVAVDDLADMLDVSREHMLRDLDMLTQVGPPDGDPGEYLLVSVEDGRVYVDLPQRLTRPLRLTPAEGCSLLLGIRTLRESGVAPFDDAMRSAEIKLLKALGRDAKEAEKLATGTIVAEPERIVAQHLRELVTAARQRRAVEIDYVSVSSHKAQRRGLDPYGIVHHAGEWYVVGHCHKRGDTRTFRIDRIASLIRSEASFTIPADFDLETYRREHLYVPSADAVAVRVHLDPLATARVGSAWPVGELTLHADGSSEIVIDCEGFEWVTGWVLGFGKHAWIVSPEEARHAMRERVERVAGALGDMGAE